MDEARAADVVGGLLRNVYHAFDYRQEERIYDTLAHSVAGDLLQRVYLETRGALELQNQGGARVKVKGVAIEAARPEVRCRRAAGSGRAVRGRRRGPSGTGATCTSGSIGTRPRSPSASWTAPGRSRISRC